MGHQFIKLLIAKHSPVNKCNVADGTVLYVRQRRTVPTKDQVEHYFLSVDDRTTRSKYGWVKEVDPFTLEDFLSTYLVGEDISDVAKKHIETMLEAADRLPPGTPVTATYRSRGVEAKRMEFSVHRVLFQEH